MSTHRIPGTPAQTTPVTDPEGAVIGRIRRDRTPEYTSPSREDGTGIIDHAVHHLRSGRWIETWYSIWVRRDNGGHEGRQAVEIAAAEAAVLIARWGLQMPAELAPMMEEPPRYTTWGAVRGCCGHAHTTAAAAERCRARDAQGCAAQDGYSDRMLRAISSRHEIASHDVTRGPGRAVSA